MCSIISSLKGYEKENLPPQLFIGLKDLFGYVHKPEYNILIGNNNLSNFARTLKLVEAFINKTENQHIFMKTIGSESNASEIQDYKDKITLTMHLFSVSFFFDVYYFVILLIFF